MTNLSDANSDMENNRWAHAPNEQRLFWITQLTENGSPGDAAVFEKQWSLVAFVATEADYAENTIVDANGDETFADTFEHTAKPPDPINPAHYRRGGIEVIDVIEAYGLDRNFRLSNSVKYILRHASKGKPLEDLKKARWYLDREISKLEAGEDD